jgi:2-dehydropantoate 2-reductase
MRIAVMGAGAVGCYYGGMLARAGNEVSLIARPAHVEAMLREGLLLESKAFTERVKVHPSTKPDAVRGAELVLFCVKSSDTEPAGKEMAPHLDAGALVLNLQNGVDNSERLQPLLKQRVAPAVVYVATEMAGPGHVRHHGRGELVVSPEIHQKLSPAFAAAGVQLKSSDNVMGTLWAKLVINCAYNALSAITQLPYGRLVQNAGVPDIMRDVVDECLALARASGVSVPGDMHETVRRIAQTMPAQFSSTAQDVARGKKTEIEHLNGYVVRKGEALGVPTPVNRTLLALVQAIERAEPRPHMGQ